MIFTNIRQGEVGGAVIETSNRLQKEIMEAFRLYIANHNQRDYRIHTTHFPNLYLAVFDNLSNIGEVERDIRTYIDEELLNLPFICLDVESYRQRIGLDNYYNNLLLPLAKRLLSAHIQGDIDNV